jgi:integrase
MGEYRQRATQCAGLAALMRRIQMAMLADAVHELAGASAQAGGSFKHQENRRHLVTPFLRFARELKALTRSLAEVKPWLVHAYAAHCVAQGMTPGHLANVFSAIRVVLDVVGNDLRKSCSNRQLGLPYRVRKGARRAQTPGELDALLERAARIDRGLGHLIALARHLGLRRLEALMCGRDLRMWLNELMSGKTRLDVMRGAKNLRARVVEVLDAQREDTIKVIQAALEYAVAHNYEFITGRGKTLESAINRLKAILRRAGMTGELSFHSLRYTYAMDLALQLLDNGVAPYETLVRLSASLGHGPTRIAMVLNYYCQPIAHRFKGCLKIHKKEAHRRSPAKQLPRAAARREAKLRHARLSGSPIGWMDLPTNAMPTVPARGARRRTAGNRPVSHARAPGRRRWPEA